MIWPPVASLVFLLHSFFSLLHPSFFDLLSGPKPPSPHLRQGHGLVANPCLQSSSSLELSRTVLTSFGFLFKCKLIKDSVVYFFTVLYYFLHSIYHPLTHYVFDCFMSITVNLNMLTWEKWIFLFPLEVKQWLACCSNINIY